MCTVSWRHEEGGYLLLCNRDEKRTRRQAHEPRREQRSSVRFLAPIDGDHGGTWLSVNEYGVTLCLLNGACISGSAATVETGMRESRGRIPLALVEAPASRHACERLAQMELSRFPAFTLLIAEPDLPVAVAEWNGAELAVLLDGERFVPLVSSSFEESAVREWRREEYRRSASLEDFHRSHRNQVGAFSTCMHREDAETVSFSEVRVNEHEITLLYSAGSPCLGLLPVRRCLTRVQ